MSSSLRTSPEPSNGQLRCVPGVDAADADAVPVRHVHYHFPHDVGVSAVEPLRHPAMLLSLDFHVLDDDDMRPEIQSRMDDESCRLYRHDFVLAVDAFPEVRHLLGSRCTRRTRLQPLRRWSFSCGSLRNLLPQTAPPVSMALQTATLLMPRSAPSAISSLSDVLPSSARSSNRKSRNHFFLSVGHPSLRLMQRSRI